MICPRCHSTIPDDSRRCPECGYTLLTSKASDSDVNRMRDSFAGYEKQYPGGGDGPEGGNGGSGQQPYGPSHPKRESHGKNGLAAVIVALVIAAVIVMLVASAGGCDAGRLGTAPSNDANTENVTNDNVTPSNDSNDDVTPRNSNSSSEDKNDSPDNGSDGSSSGNENGNSPTGSNASDNGAHNGNTASSVDESDESGLVGTWTGTLTKCSGGCYASQLPEFATTLTIHSYDPTTGKVKLTLSRCDHNHDKLDNDADSTPGDSLVTADYTATMDNGFFKLDKLTVGGKAEFWTYVEVNVANADSPSPSMTLTYSFQKTEYNGYTTYDEFTMTKES